MLRKEEAGRKISTRGAGFDWSPRQSGVGLRWNAGAAMGMRGNDGYKREEGRNEGKNWGDGDGSREITMLPSRRGFLPRVYDGPSHGFERLDILVMSSLLYINFISLY